MSNPTPTWFPLDGCPGLQRYDRRSGSSYRLRVSVDGEARRIPIVATTDIQAIALAWKVRADLEAGRPVDGATLGELLDEFERRWPIAPSTMQLYRSRIVMFAGSLNGKPAAEISTADVRAWLHGLSGLRKPNGQPYSPNSVHGVRTAVAALFAFAVRAGVSDSNPFRGLDSKDAIVRQRRDEPRTVTLQLADAVAEATGEPTMRALVRFAIRTGLRSSELRAIRWENVDLAARTYQLRQQVSLDGDVVDRLKTARSGRRTPLLTPARDELIRWKKESSLETGLIFPNRYGNPINRNRLRTALDRASAKIGIEPAVTPHVFRHSFTAIMRATGIGQADLATLCRDAIETVARFYDANVDTAMRADDVATLAFGASV